MPIITYKLFIASSMSNPWRNKITSVVNDVNTTLKMVGLSVEFEPIVYSETPIPDGTSDTQKIIDRGACNSDIVVLLAENNKCIGPYTIEEYETAHAQSQQAANKRPLIKVFALIKEDKETINIPYINNDIEEDFEDRLMRDSGRYLQCIRDDNFKNFFRSWLIRIAAVSLDNCYSQAELSYSKHINENGQGLIRISDNKYYYREKLDGGINEILKVSPIVILEGSTYSGKTRAAYQVMTDNDEWKDYDFHIYSNKHSLQSLNNIRPDWTSDNKGDVFLIDDINDIIEDKKIVIDGYPLWEKFNGIKRGVGFSKSDFGNTRIIITVSGKLRDEEKRSLYARIFNTEGTKLNEYLAKITVDFDIYDRRSFKEIVDQMRRTGAIMGQIRPGNYTIGSLYIKDDEVRSFAKEMNPIILKTLVGHYRYAKYTGFWGNIEEVKSLYDYLKGTSFEDDIEKLRIKGFLIKKENVINIDEFAIDIFTDVVISHIEGLRSRNEKLKGSEILNNELIGYAQYCKENCSENIDSVAKMGYLICDRNKLSDNEIIKLISAVVKATLGNKKEVQIADVITLSQCDNNYSSVFCETAIAKFKNFASSMKYINMISKNKCAESLFKRAVFAMFNKNNRAITMVEERTLLEYVFTENNTWKEPFNESDLDDVFNLSRIIPYLQLKAVDIINYIKNATLNGVELSQDCVDDSNNNNVIDSDDQDTSLYDKVFIPRMADAVVTALCKIDSYEEFEEVAKVISEAMDNSANMQTAIKTCFSSKFYYRVPDIAQRLSYEDRKKLFDFILAIPETKTIFGHEDDANNTKASKIVPLNKLLEVLDDNDALESFEKMMKTSLYDMRTLSHLMNNRLLNFEQLMPLVLRYPNQKNYLTLNQLMDKAETTSDAHNCMRLMGIKDAKPEKLRDEHALLGYIKIKTISSERSFSILREWHNLNSNRRLSDIALNPVVNKLSIEDLFTIMDPEDGVEVDYMERYGLLKEEVESMRKNAVFYTMLFYRANTNATYKDRIKKIYERLLADDKLRPLVIDLENNANNGIISVYIKNRMLFDDYKKVKTAVAEIEEKYGDIFRKDNNIYEPLLWWAAEKNKDIGEVNRLLIEAYDYFAKYYTRDRVVEMMSELYHYVPKCLSESDLDASDASLKIACEGGMKLGGSEKPGTPQKWSNFYEYVKHLSEKDSTYIDGTFIFNTLKLMVEREHTNLYELLANIAHRNRKGVKYDTVYKLPELVRQRLFWVDRENADIIMDRRFCHNTPIVKLLWYIAFKQGWFSVKQTIDYVVNNNIPITQTLVNMLFKIIEQGKSADGSKFNQIVNLLDSITNRTELFHRSVQMCISLIAVASNEQELEDIFTTHGFDQLRYRTEVIGARINRLLNLRHKVKGGNRMFNSIKEFKNELKENRAQINISVINTYLHALFMVMVNDLLDRDMSATDARGILDRCWPTIINEQVIDVNELLELGDECAEWRTDIDVQTLSYFVNQCNGKRLISMMGKMFNEDFYYDENKKKNCLKDAVKNYSREGYGTGKEREAEVDYIVDVILREENSDVCVDLCKSYVYKEYWENNCVKREYKGYVGDKKVFPFWKAALCNQRFKDYIKSKGVQFYEDDLMV